VMEALSAAANSGHTLAMDWILEAAERAAFVGDVLCHDVRSYLSDSHSGEWLANLDQLEKTLDVKTLFPGHEALGQEGLFE